MAIVITASGFTPESGASAGASTFTTSASLTATANRLMGAFVFFRGDSGTWTNVDTATLTGCLDTWTLHKSSTALDAGSATAGVYFFRGVDATPTVQALTFTAPSGETFQSYKIIVVDFASAATDGTNGSGGFVTANDTTHNTSSGAEPYVLTYTQAFTSSSNAGITVAMRLSGSQSSTASRAGWTELAGTDGSVGSGGSLFVTALHWRADSDTQDDYTYGSSGSHRRGLALEVVESVTATNINAEAVTSTFDTLTNDFSVYISYATEFNFESEVRDDSSITTTLAQSVANLVQTGAAYVKLGVSFVTNVIAQIVRK